MKRQWMNLLVAVIGLVLFLSAARAQYTWTNNPGNPCWSNGTLALEPAVLYDATRAKYDLWYSDWYNIKRLESSDGVSWSYTGRTQNLASLFSNGIFGGAEVYKVGSTYYAYPWLQDQSGGWYIGLASSPDGNVWTKHSSGPALTKGAPGSWDAASVLGSRITMKDGLYYMFYTGNSGIGNEIGLAVSADGVHWEKSGGNPVIGQKAMGANTSTVGTVGVEFVGGVFYLVLKVTNAANEQTYNLLTSTDGVSWSFYEGNPILARGGSGAWNSMDIGGGVLRYVSGQFRLWYCGDDYSQVWRVGLATSAPGTPPETFWHPTNGPGVNQDVRSLASNSHGDLFAGTWTAGEVYKTTNNGDSWTVCGAIPNTNPVLGLAVDQHDHIFASVYLRGVARSTDDGASWQMKNSGLTNVASRDIMVDKQNRIWVATEAGLFRSTDDGENWTNVRAAYLGAVFQDSTGAILTQINDGSGNATLYRSSDGGNSWSSNFLTGFGIHGIHADGSYWGGSADFSKVEHSTDFGVTWTQSYTGVVWSGVYIKTMFTPQGDIFLSSAGNTGGVLRSTNNGTSWEVTNSGLTTTQVACLYYHPDGTLFLGTKGAGVFRNSVAPIPPQDIIVSLPNIATAAGTSVEIPIDVTSLSGQGILSYEFTLTCNSPDSILSFDASPVTAGTLSGANGWSVQVNSTAPNQVKVGAFGAAPLFGKGTLLKLKARVVAGAAAGDSTGLVLSNFLFNAGTPQPSLLNGSVTIHERVCGDADESGSVQAYDAALALREAMGPMSPPPAPLTVMGRINADVNMDGKVQAYDAALILTHVVGLPMPESTATCFGAQGIAGSPASLSLTGHLDSRQYVGGKWVVQVRLSGVPADLPVISCAFELTMPVSWGDNVNLTLPQLAQGYLATVNPLGNGQFKVGIINPNGVDVENIPLTLTSNSSSSLNAVTFSELFLNDVPNDTITLSNIFTSVDPSRPVNPQSYELVGAYPNPFNPSTRIVFQTPVGGPVRLEIYNMQGIRIKTLRDEQTASGRHEIFWDGTNSLGQNVATGEYFCLMRAGSFVKTLRLMLLK